MTTIVLVFSAPSSTRSSHFEQEKITLKKKNHLQVACSKDFDLTLQDVEMESLEVWELNWKGGNRRVDFC